MKEMTSKTIAERIAKVLDDHKAEDIMTIDVRERTPFTDYIVIATAGNERALNALSNNVNDALEEDGVEIRLTDGEVESGWIVVDVGEVMVHLFLEFRRKEYGLEELLAKPRKK